MFKKPGFMAIVLRKEALMNTQCNDQQLTLQGFDKRKIIIKNDASVNSSDGGLLLLGKLEHRFGGNATVLNIACQVCSPSGYSASSKGMRISTTTKNSAKIHSCNISAAEVRI